MSDYTRSDSLAEKSIDDPESFWGEWVKLARTLERENSRLRSALKEIVEIHRGWCEYCGGNEKWCLSGTWDMCVVKKHEAIIALAQRGGT